jgi:beta-galactosidase
MKGIVSLTFVLRRKIHLKGFRFVEIRKAHGKLDALESSRIYGDAFTLTESAVEGIGNNVSLVFEGMDFGDQACSRIVICGRSPLPNNTLHLLFSGPEGESKQLVEFAGADDYIEREFKLEPVCGSLTVTFLFLPGSCFDFRWFQFLP